MTKNTRSRWGVMISAAVLISGALMSQGSAHAAHDDVPPGIRFAENADLSESEILSRTERLNERYTKVGQRLTPNDAEFVALYAQVPADDPSRADTSSMTTMAMYGPFTFHKTARAAGGTGTIKGSMRLTIGDFSANNSWRASMTSTGSSAVKNYSAFVVYATITSDAVFYTSRGSFQVSS